MAEAIVSTVVETLGGLLTEEAKFLSGVTDQVQEVSRELKRMQCFLRDADERDCRDDETVSNWLREIKSLTYRVEDIVETYAAEVAAKRGRGVKKALIRFACIFCEAKSLHNLGLEIAKVKNDISNLTTSFQSYDRRAISEAESSGLATTNANHKWARQTYPDEVEEYFIGMEEDIRKLVSLVVDDSKHCAKISIWGMGGLGKTTIARKIYKHIDVQRCFERFAWVCITQQGQIRGILQDILMQLCPDDKKGEIKDMEDRELVQQLYRVQTKSKCLVVLDDIWDMQHWENLVHAFPVVERGSKILLTTRTKEVAEIGFTYKLKCLNDQESWELLKLIAFSRKSSEGKYPELEPVGVEMVRKCGGLPLAICVLGGILKDKDSSKDWHIVNKNIGSFLSTGKGSGEGSGEGAIRRVLSLSYTALPYYLKPCFLYLGNFLEDETINAEQLYLLWIAEGMVLSEHRRNGETLMEVAERYLDELGQRCMVQVQMDEFSIFRRFHSCRLHDMMRDFCLGKGREEEFVRVIDLRGLKKALLDSLSSTNNAAYRIAVHINIDVEAPGNGITVLEEDYKQLRSFLIQNCDLLARKIIVPEEKNIRYENFKSLRVLKFENYNFGGQRLPAGLKKLIHLRLLSFRECGNLREIPPSIAKLPFLQTLDLRVQHPIKLPDMFGKMKKMRHLYLPKYLSTGNQKGKLRLNGVTELETLDGFQSDNFEVADLHELSNLRLLKATVTDNESLCVIINHITNGQNLQETQLSVNSTLSFSSEQGSVLLKKILECEKLHKLELVVKISKFPQHEVHFLRVLVGLTLSYTKIDEDPMETLEKLRQLRYLTFSHQSYVGTDLICHERGFPQLRHLTLCSLPNLTNWRVDKGGLPNLSYLGIHDCLMLDMIPEGLKYVAGLKELTIGHMLPSFVGRLKVIDGREGEDFDKIRHVPSITFEARY